MLRCREEIAELCVAILDEPSALNSTFEVRSTVPFSEPFKGLSNPQQERDWRSLLQAAKLDPKITGKMESEESERENAAFSSAAI